MPHDESGMDGMDGMGWDGWGGLGKAGMGWGELGWAGVGGVGLLMNSFEHTHVTATWTDSNILANELKPQTDRGRGGGWVLWWVV